MQGFLRRLLDRDDALARSLRARATFRLVPCMNPDGAFRGHLRTNAGGANLNREWVSDLYGLSCHCCYCYYYYCCYYCNRLSS
jgi:murein tripeptide amidase MpaA